MKRGSFAALALLVATAGTAPIGSAEAAPVTETYNLTLSGFVDIQGLVATPPVSTIDLSVTLTFDTALNYSDDTTDITVNSLTGFAPASPIGFTYFAASDELFIGGTQNGSNLVVTGTDDLVVALDVATPGVPTFIPCDGPGIICGNQTGNAAFDASGYTTTTDAASLFFIGAEESSTGVPEPSEVAVLILPLLGLGWIARRRRSRA